MKAKARTVLLSAALLVLPVLLVSCGGTPAAPPVPVQQTTIAPPLPPPPDTTTYTLSGRVLVAQYICTGVQLSAEAYEEMRRHKPRGGVHIYLKADTINADSIPVAYQALTDAKGRFALRVKPGTYSVLIDEQGGSAKFDRTRYIHDVSVMPGLYKKWWRTPQAVVKVSADTIIRDLLFSQNCSVESLCPYLVNPMAMRVP